MFKAFGQEPYFLKYDIEEGIPTSNIYSAFEDDKGYIWFTSDVGVLQFDGYNFTHFNTDNGLGDNEIFRIYQDAQNRMWFLSLNGSLSYYENGEFFGEYNKPFIKELSHPKIVMDIYEDEEGELYFLYRDGHISILHNDMTTETIQIGQADVAFSVWKNDGEIVVLTRRSVQNLASEHIIKFEDINYSASGFRSWMSENGEYYFSSTNAVYRFSEVDNYTEHFESPSLDIIFLGGLNGNMWLGTRNGLVIKEENVTRHYFKDDMVSSAIQDSQGNYWITTLNNGIKFIPSLEVQSLSFNSDVLKINDLQKDDNNNLWVGTDAGLYVKNGSTGKEEYAAREKVNIKNVRKSDSVMYAVSKYIDVYNGFERKRYRFPANDILAVGDTFYLGSSNYTCQLKQQTFFNLFYKYGAGLHKKMKGYAKLNKRTNVIVLGEEQIYIGTSTGLYTFKEGIATMIQSPNNELNTSIMDLMFDSETNRLIVATNSKGIVILQDNHVIHQIGSLQGLLSNGVYSIAKQHRNSYLVGTNKGVNKVILDNDTIEVIDYNRRLALKEERVNDIEIIDNNVYFATDTEVISFVSNNLNEDTHTPYLQIDKVHVNGVLRDDLTDLDHTENTISIDYTGISYTDYGSITYEYRLNNEVSWTTTTNRRIDFKNLPHGTYSFEVRVLGRNEIRSEPKLVSFSIKPPFWKTVPFILSALLLTFVLTLYTVKRRMQSIRNKFELERASMQAQQEKTVLEKQMIELEQKALRLQMNPHFIFNTLNTIKGYYSGGDIKDANVYISRFSKLLRLLLENDNPIVSIEKEIEMLELYIRLIQQRYQDVFNYEINVSSEIDIEETGVPTLLLQPMVENAIIHGMAGNTITGVLKIGFSFNKGKLQCVVSDNGVGYENTIRQKQEKHESKAIKITKERVKFLNSIDDTNNFVINTLSEPTGTEVIIYLPILKLW